MFRFLTSDHVMIPQRTVSFKCPLIHVHRRAYRYVCIFMKRKKANSMGITWSESAKQKLPPSQAHHFSRRGERETRVAREWLVTKRTRLWEGEEWEAKRVCRFPTSHPSMHANFQLACSRRLDRGKGATRCFFPLSYFASYSSIRTPGTG